MRAVAAPDKFRDSVTAAQAARAIAAGAAAVGWTCREVPLADGGEGTLDALGGPNRVTRVTGPLGDPVKAGWRIDGETAVIEMARASSLAVAGGRAANKPLLASTHGTGELIAAAISAGARHIVGVGGSATTDGGFGAPEALGPRRSRLHSRSDRRRLLAAPATPRSEPSSTRRTRSKACTSASHGELFGDRSDYCFSRCVQQRHLGDGGRVRLRFLGRELAGNLASPIR